jgi:hypothetical protein
MYMSYKFADSLLASCQQTCRTYTLLTKVNGDEPLQDYTIAVCKVKNSWWWTQELSKTCRVLIHKNKFAKSVHLVGFIAGPSGRPRGLRRRSAAARLLESWVRIPPEHGCLSVVSVVCCRIEVSATSCSFVQRCPTDCGASLSVI